MCQVGCAAQGMNSASGVANKTDAEQTSSQLWQSLSAWCTCRQKHLRVLPPDYDATASAAALSLPKVPTDGPRRMLS
eukprot:1244477-Amphidinium_carterae.1